MTDQRATFRTAEQVRSLRGRLRPNRWSSLTQATFAIRLGVSRRTVIRWERDGVPPHANAESIDAYHALEDSVSQLDIDQYMSRRRDLA